MSLLSIVLYKASEKSNFFIHHYKNIYLYIVPEVTQVGNIFFILAAHQTAIKDIANIQYLHDVI